MQKKIPRPIRKAVKKAMSQGCAKIGWFAPGLWIQKVSNSMIEAWKKDKKFYKQIIEFYGSPIIAEGFFKRDRIDEGYYLTTDDGLLSALMAHVFCRIDCSEEEISRWVLLVLIKQNLISPLWIGGMTRRRL